MLSTGLTHAARNLEERFDLVRIPTRNVPVERWNLIPRVGELVPAWLKNLLILSAYRLVDGVLEYRDRSGSFVRLFRFFDDIQFSIHLEPESLTVRLCEYGYLPLAHEADGSLWIISGREESGTIFLLDHSSWDGREPTPTNGLVFAASRLDLLLVTMGLSDASFGSQNRLPHSIMWYKAEHP